MPKRNRTYFNLISIIGCLLLSFDAQAQFGSAVSVVDDNVYVMKQGGAFGGLGVVSVFEKDGSGAWVLGQRIASQDGLETGRPFTPSFWVEDGEMLIGGGDPHASHGAYRFAKVGTEWVEANGVWIDESVEASLGDNMQVADFMKYVQPPRRVVSVDNDVMALGVTQVAWERAGVHIYSKTEEGWQQSVRIQDPKESRNSRFGASVVLAENLLLVGAPGGDEGGRAYAFEYKDDAGWVLQDTLSVDAAGARFGSSVSVWGERLLVGAPGASGAAGALYVFANVDGKWQESGKLVSPEEEGGAMFGSAFGQVGDELWVGAPGSSGRMGAVHRFEEADGGFVHRAVLEPEAGGGQSMFGASIAGSANTSVIGGISRNGGEGGAYVFEKNNNDAWVQSALLLPRTPLTTIEGEQITCEEGKADQFDCDGVDLLSYVPMSGFGADASERVSDVWGWTDPLTKREYALLGRTAGAAIIDVTNPILPVYMGLVPANPTPTRDLKVYKDHLFFTGDGAGDHGLVIFNLMRLRDVSAPPMTLEADTVYAGIASAHNLIMNEESGFAYPVGASQGGETCGGGLHMVDVREPLNPTFAGCFTDTIGLFSDGRTHDGQCVNYIGPDTRYTGQEICFVSNETALRIVDVSDKENPEPLAAAKYPRVAYVHQGWLTDDHRYFYLDDELDELVGMTAKTRTLVWDIAELDDPVLVGAFEGSTTATDHNLYIKGDRMYQANYQAGLRIWDVSNPELPIEIGHFDTTPNMANPPGFVGAWTAYPYFESGTIIVSSMNEGLFVVKPSDEQVP